MRRLLFAALIAAVLAPPASASQLIDRNQASGIRLKVSPRRQGDAVVSRAGAALGRGSPGARSTRDPIRARPASRCSSGSTAPAAGARSAGSSGSGTPAGRTTGRRSCTSSGPARRRTGRTGRCRSGVARSRTSASRRGGRISALGPFTSPTGPARSRSHFKSIRRGSARLGRPPLPLDRPARRPRGIHGLVVERPVPPHLRPADLPRTPRPRLQDDEVRRPARQVRRAVYLDTFGSKHAAGLGRARRPSHSASGTVVAARTRRDPQATGVFCYTFRGAIRSRDGYAHPPGYRGGARVAPGTARPIG